MKHSPLIVVVLTLMSSASFGQSLSELEKSALTNHPTLAAAKQNVDSAKWRGEMLLAPYRPSLSLNGYFADGTGMPIFPSTVMPVNYANLGVDGWASANLMLMWPLSTGGRDRTARLMGGAFVDQASAQESGVRNTVVRQVRSSLADYLYAMDMLSATKSDLEAAKQAESDSRKREEAGSAPKAFTLRAVAEARRVEGQVAVAAAKVSQKRAELEAAVGSPLDGSDGVSWDGVLDAPDSLEAAIALAKSQRPELDAVKERKTISLLNFDMASRSQRPEVSFMAMNDFMSGSSMTPIQRYKFGLVVSIPLLDGKMRKSQKEEAQSMALSASQDHDALVLTLVQEVKSAWADWLASAELLTSAQAGVDAAEEAYRAETLRYESGKSILAEFLDAKSMLFMARAGQADAVRFRRNAWAQLEFAVGEQVN